MSPPPNHKPPTPQTLDTRLGRLEHEDSLRIPARELRERIQRIEFALFGDPSNPSTTALMPLLQRLDAWLTAACWIWRAILAAAVTSASMLAATKTMGLW